MIFEEPIVELLISMVVEIVVASGRTEEQDRRRSGTDFHYSLVRCVTANYEVSPCLNFKKQGGQ